MPSFCFSAYSFNRLLGGLQDAVPSPEDCERQDDPSVLGLLVVAPQQVGDGPDEGRESLLIHYGDVLFPKLMGQAYSP